MTSCRPAPDAFRLAWMAGAATLATDASNNAMNWPVRTTARIPPGLDARRWDGRAGPAVMRVSVMEPSLPRFGYRYQKPGYPGTSSTWQPPGGPGRMGV